MILFASLFLAVYQTVNGTCATYYAQYILGNNEYYSVLNLAENIPQVAVIMILAPFIKKFGKRYCRRYRRQADGYVRLYRSGAGDSVRCIRAPMRRP